MLEKRCDHTLRRPRARAGMPRPSPAVRQQRALAAATHPCPTHPGGDELRCPSRRSPHSSTHPRRRAPDLRWQRLLPAPPVRQPRSADPPAAAPAPSRAAVDGPLPCTEPQQGRPAPRPRLEPQQHRRQALSLNSNVGAIERRDGSLFGWLCASLRLVTVFSSVQVKSDICKLIFAGGEQRK